MEFTEKCVNVAVRKSDREYLKEQKKKTGKAIYTIVGEIIEKQTGKANTEPVEHYESIHWPGEKPFKNLNVRIEDSDFIEKLAAEKGTFKYGAVQELIKAYKVLHGLEDGQ